MKKSEIKLKFEIGDSFFCFQVKMNGSSVDLEIQVNTINCGHWWCGVGVWFGRG